MKYKAQILDATALRRALTRITHEIIERNGGVDDICILGIKSRGIPLAKILCENIKTFEGVDVPCGWLDITLHRDDMPAEKKKIMAGDCHFPCDITDKIVILVDDVMFTGRTVRAAIESVFEFARPKAIQLAVLVDRGHRELPLRPDYVGKNVPTSKSEKIKVCMLDTDGEEGVYICDVE
ncbi:MAG: bifunctional pyr operon transcriptional regulator/uracil phosphoribosyltransferase PyrR [Clostridia bacterium]|nr:bifunctional pyr operon transcriptional regulator/uracil phosphoribosyltransferase PyrR [Clostridia bacterium]